MYYIFNKSGECVSSCDFAPNTEDLATRGEMAVKSERVYDISEIRLTKGEIEKKPTEPANDVPTEPYTDPERLAAFEAMAAQEARLIAHGERIAVLEAALKGGEGK